MNEFERLLCFLKVQYHNMTTLHRHLHPPDKPEKTPDKQLRKRKKVQDDAEP